MKIGRDVRALRGNTFPNLTGDKLRESAGDKPQGLLEMWVPNLLGDFLQKGVKVSICTFILSVILFLRFI